MTPLPPLIKCRLAQHPANFLPLPQQKSNVIHLFLFYCFFFPINPKGTLRRNPTPFSKIEQAILLWFFASPAAHPPFTDSASPRLTLVTLPWCPTRSVIFISDQTCSLLFRTLQSRLLLCFLNWSPCSFKDQAIAIAVLCFPGSQAVSTACVRRPCHRIICLSLETLTNICATVETKKRTLFCIKETTAEDNLLFFWYPKLTKHRHYQKHAGTSGHGSWECRALADCE